MKNITFIRQKSDFSILVKGIERLGYAIAENNSKKCNKLWINSSVKQIIEKNLKINDKSSFNRHMTETSLQKNATEIYEKLYVVKEGIKLLYKGSDLEKINPVPGNRELPSQTPLNDQNAKEVPHPASLNVDERIKESVTSPHFHPNLKEKLEFNERILKFDSFLNEVESNIPQNETTYITDDDLLAINRKVTDLKLSEFGYDDRTFEECIPSTDVNSPQSQNITADSEVDICPESGSSPIFNIETPKSIKQPTLIGRKPLAKSKATSTLSNDATARKVPQSRLSRLLTFGNLAAGLSVGTLAEMTRRTLGIENANGSNSLLASSPFLTDANAKRIVSTLCKVRGAALKLGQMLSIQDSALINPQLQKIFERVRQSADFMPMWQLERTLKKDFGTEWRNLVSSFDDRPFAAASIGQVHQAILLDGRPVAMKVQYPGVAKGINSDIDNLITTLSVAQILPEGLYVDSAIEVAKKELSWECDYIREKKCTKTYRDLVKPFSQYFYVPEVVDELCSEQVFTTELIEGVPVDKCVTMDQETRNYISNLLLKLCLLELFSFGFMQTDPNWANFFYNQDTKQLALLDFGACRQYDKSFIDKYINVIHGAATKDRHKVEEYSIQLGFLTGHEAKIMTEAHIDAVMILGEAFQHDRPYSFSDQQTTRRIQKLIPVMLAHRMCPPPEEIYSLHRKISGAFLLCAKLEGVVNCKPFFDNLYNNYKPGGTWEDARRNDISIEL